MAFSEQKFDVIIIGGGPAGLSTALWCADLGLSVLVLERQPEFGGQLLNIYNPIKNYLGRETANGREMRDIFLAQVRERLIDLKSGAELSDINLENLSIALSDGSVVNGNALVIATGVRRRGLNVEGESQFYGKGIIESGQRDKNLVKNKRVLIVGGGDAALENALLLSKTAKEVFVVHRRKKFRARQEFVERLNNNPRVKVLFESVVTRFTGDEALTGAHVQNIRTRTIEPLETDAALIRVGVEPNTDFLNRMLQLDTEGYIVVNSGCETDLPRVFAVGDVANPTSPTISTAAGTGATAAKTIRFLLNHKKGL
jgi:thioredoxin reductase (NADPH)